MGFFYSTTMKNYQFKYSIEFGKGKKGKTQICQVDAMTITEALAQANDMVTFIYGDKVLMDELIYSATLVEIAILKPVSI
jgi:hypothetical protein